MTPLQVKEYFGNGYKFNKSTGMSDSTLGNWLKWGFVPLESQRKLEILTNGKLKADWNTGGKNERR